MDNYDAISTNILGLLENFSNHILTIEDSINSILMSGTMNNNSDFLQFVNAFSLGRYYHFQCQGYMKALVVTKCYSPASICFWLNSLVYPAIQNFMEALAYFQKVEPAISQGPYAYIVSQIDEFKKVAMEIQQAIGAYNLRCY